MIVGNAPSFTRSTQALVSGASALPSSSRQLRDGTGGAGSLRKRPIWLLGPCMSVLMTAMR